MKKVLSAQNECFEELSACGWLIPYNLMHWSSERNYMIWSELTLNTDDTEETFVKISTPNKQLLVRSIHIPHDACFNNFSSNFEKKIRP